MANNPQFVSAPVIGSARVASAYTTIDAASEGSLAVLVTGAADGTRVLEIVAQAQATAAAAIINVFLSTDGGTTYFLFDQISISAATPSATVKANRNSAVYQNLVLASGDKLAVATTIAQATAVHALGGDL